MFNIFPLTATPQNSVAQCPPKSLNMQNTVTLRRTGVYSVSVGAEHHLIFIQNQSIIISLVTSPAGALFFFFPAPSLEETCMELAQAIETGDMQFASIIAAALSRQLVKLKIQPSTTNYEDSEIR